MPNDAPLPTVVEAYESHGGEASRRWVVLWNGIPMLRTYPSLRAALESVAAMLSAWEQWRASWIASRPDPAR